MRALFLSFCMLFFMGGCTSTPTTQIAEFGNSVTAITNNVDAVIQEYNNTVLETQFTNYAASYKNEHAKYLSSNELAKIKKPITTKKYKSLSVSQANKALGDYSSALSLMSTAGSQGDIDLAAGNLYGAMVSLNDQYKVIKETNEELFNDDNFSNTAKLIAAIGNVIAEEKRQKAIKQIVVMANDNIAQVCDEIINELKIAGMGDSIAASRQYMLTEELKEYKSLAEKSSTLAWRKAEISRLYNLQQDVFNSKLLVQQAQQAILAVKKTHAVLTNELKKDKFTSASITIAIGRLKVLNENNNNFNSLISSCENLIKNDKGILSCDDN